MAITVREALTIGPLSRAGVVAGAGGLDRVIETITVLEAPDSSEWIRGRELVLTIGCMYRDNPQALAVLVEELVKRDAAALGIKFGRYIESLPQVAKDTADRLDFPVLAIPYDCSWIDILSPLYNYLLDEETKRRFHAQQANAHFISILLKNEGLPALLTSLTQMIRCPVAVFDMNKNLLACAVPEGNPAQERDVVAHLGNVAGDEGLRLSFPISLANTRVGFLEVYAQDPLPALSIITVNQAVIAISLQLIKEQAVREVERRYENQFITDLLNRNFDSKDVVLKRAEAFGWNLSRPHVTVLVEIDRLDTHFLQHGNAQEYRSKKDRLLDLVRHKLARQFGDGIVVDYGNYVLIIVMEEAGDRHGPKTRSPALQVARSIVEEAGRVLLPSTVSAGISTRHQEITDLSSSYLEAKQALIFGRMVHGNGSVTRFEDLGVYRLLCRLPREELDEFVAQHLGGLLRLNPKQRTTLLETLRCYLQHGGNISEAAQALFLHRRTLRYRLNRIEDLLQVDLSNPVNKLNLTVAFMALALLEGSRQITPR